jgi:hypothetical protein
MRALLLAATAHESVQPATVARRLRDQRGGRHRKRGRRTDRRDRIMAKLNPIELQKALKGASYPTSKDDLVKIAKENGASDDIVAALENLGDDRFNTPADLTEAVSFATKGS